jgi:hypothetical protein
VLVDLLTARATVILLSQLLGRLVARLHRPLVIGEILAGLAMGPSLLGRFLPEVQHAIFPATALTPINVTAQLGVVLYMFLIGLELDAGVVRRQLVLYPRFSPASVPHGIFVLFIGVSMCVTAFPVLARILADCGMTHTWLGILALASAAVADVCAWCLLTLVVGPRADRRQPDYGGADYRRVCRRDVVSCPACDETARTQARAGHVRRDINRVRTHCDAGLGADYRGRRYSWGFRRLPDGQLFRMTAGWLAACSV